MCHLPYLQDNLDNAIILHIQPDFQWSVLDQAQSQLAQNNTPVAVLIHCGRCRNRVVTFLQQDSKNKGAV
jgi:hypothetical protein